MQGRQRVNGNEHAPARESVGRHLTRCPASVSVLLSAHSRMGSQFTANSSAVVARLVGSAGKLRGAELAVGHLGDRNGESLYDSVRVSPNRVLFGFIDAANRGKESVIVGAALDTFRARAGELFAGEEVNEANAMIELCLQLNRSILDAAGGVSSCPAFAGCYDEDLATVCYINAGHTPALVRDSTGVNELAPTGLPLGLFSHVTCDARMIALEPGAVLTFVSGETFEIRESHDQSALTRVKQNLQRTDIGGAQEICQMLLRSAVAESANNVAALALLRCR
jgi:hypothetical protein